MHTVDRILRIAACSLALLGCATMPASADSSTGTLVAEPEPDQPADLIGRGYFQLAMEGGQQRKVRIVVGNTSSEPMTIRAYPVDGLPTPGGGISFNTFDQPVVRDGTWLSLDSPSMELAPGESRRVTATINVAPNATTGDHVAGIAVEDARSRPSSTDAQVVINVFYRRAIAVVVAVPGERTSALDVDSVALSQDARGNHAVVQIRNTGNTLLKATGTLEITGLQASGRAQTFTVDTLIPITGAAVDVRLPGLRLAKGTYNAHVVMQTEDGHPLADWEGTAGFLLPAPAEATALPFSDVSLAPVDAPAPAATLADEDAAALAGQAAATSSAGFWLLGILAVVLVTLRAVSSRLVRRRR